MKFTELQKILNKSLGIEKLADIARELDVTPQVVSNWKAKDNVPYKNVYALRKILKKIKKQTIAEENYFNQQTSLYDNSEDDKTILDLILIPISIIFKNYVVFIIPILLSVAIAAIHLKYYAVPIFVSSAKVLPYLDDGSKTSNISNLAAQFGLGSMGSSESSLASSIMVPHILKSRRLASELLFFEFYFNGEKKLKNLASILSGRHINSDSISQNKMNKLTTKISKLIRVKQNPSDPIINISAKSFDAKLAKDIVDAIIEQCNVMINEFKYKELEEKKTYISQRLIDISNELESSEEILRSFREKNRNIMSSPSLLLEQARLLREVELQNELYIRLKSEFELLQIEDVGGNEALQILDFAEIPIKKTTPKPLQFMTIMFLFGTFAGFVFAYFKDWLYENDLKTVLIKNNINF
jgi:uncharacterized protein involved in exopolysaccharide biosynthesis